MGMDLNIYAAKNHEVFKHDGWWDSPDVKEEFYSRKYWAIPEHCSFVPKDYEDGEALELSYENIVEMIEVACQHRNYWGTYDEVPKLCELRDKYESLEEEGYKLYLRYTV